METVKRFLSGPLNLRVDVSQQHVQRRLDAMISQHAQGTHRLRTHLCTAAKQDPTDKRRRRTPLRQATDPATPHDLRRGVGEEQLSNPLLTGRVEGVPLKRLTRSLELAALEQRPWIGTCGRSRRSDRRSDLRRHEWRCARWRRCRLGRSRLRRGSGNAAGLYR